MACRGFELEGVGTVTLYKRRGVRNIRLSIGHDGNVRVTMPVWAPFKLGRAFAVQKRAWLLAQRPTPQPLKDKSRIGKAHQLVFEHKPVAVISSRVANNNISIVIPLGALLESPAVQGVARQAAVRALKKEAKTLLPKRLAELATKHNFEYTSVKIKELRGRWGSCSQHKDIVLNCYLMELPWQLIDYVILHELLHTRILAHGKPFWEELAHYVPNLSQTRETMRQIQPTLRNPKLEIRNKSEIRNVSN